MRSSAGKRAIIEWHKRAGIGMGYVESDSYRILESLINEAVRGAARDQKAKSYLKSKAGQARLKAIREATERIEARMKEEKSPDHSAGARLDETNEP